MEQTKINLDQLQGLINVMESTKTTSANAIENYESAMNSLITSGKIAGTMVDVLQSNITKIKSLTNEFSSYCENVKQSLNKIITSATEIENKYSNMYEDLLSQDPTNFNG